MRTIIASVIVTLATMPVSNAATEQQRIEDARAMVRESWAGYGLSIQTVMVAYKCDLVDKVAADTAIMTIWRVMDNIKVQAGLINDPTIQLRDYSDAGIRAGIADVQNGACGRLTPAARGRLRSLIYGLH